MKLTLVPTAGLCNRMNAIICGISINRATGCDLNILWQKSHECKAHFNDLFKPLGNTASNVTVKPLKSFYYQPPRMRNLKIPQFLRSLFPKGGEIDAQINGSDTTSLTIQQLFENRQHIYVHSFNRFCLHEPINNVGDIFIPNSDIEALITEVVSQYSEHSIGLHIRRTDNVVSISQSPLELFEKAIDRELEVNPDTRIFIASDSQEVIKKLSELYPGKVVAPNPGKNLRRDSVRGMQQAVADLYCLAHTKKIYGSAGSTFSLMASKLFGTPLEILTL